MDNQDRSLNPDIVGRVAISSSQADPDSVEIDEDFEDASTNNFFLLLTDRFATDHLPPIVFMEEVFMESTQSQTREDPALWNGPITNSNRFHTDTENLQTTFDTLNVHSEIQIPGDSPLNPLILDLETEIPEGSPLKSGTYFNIRKMSSPRKRKHQGDKASKKGGGRRRKTYPDLEQKRLDPKYRDPSMKFFGIQSQSNGYENEGDQKKRFGFVASRYKVCHDLALCAVLKKESDHDYEQLPRSSRIFDVKNTSKLCGSCFKKLDFQCEIIDTSSWWHARYNTNEFLYENYWCKNVFLISDITINDEVIPKYSIISGYKINNDKWKSIRFGLGRKKQVRKNDENAWKNYFYGDPFFVPDVNPQEDPQIAIRKIREIRGSDKIQLRVLVFTETAQFGKQGSLKDASKVLAEKIEEKLRAT